MKKLALCFIASLITSSLLLCHTRTTTVNCPALNVTYGTGRCEVDEKMDGRIEISPIGGSYIRTGWAIFNLSSLPEDAVIEEVVAHFYHTNSNQFHAYVHELTIDPRTASAATTGSFRARPAPSRCCTPTRAGWTITRMSIW